MTSLTLTEDQQRLVSDNIGLVGVHLKRYVRAPVEPTRRCERDDLFQEGCLALARAAKEYDPRRHGAFQGYALNRIHSAVSQALYEKFTIVHVPYQVARGHRPDPRVRGLSAAQGAGADQTGGGRSSPPADRVLEDVDLSMLRARSANLPEVETLGDRMRAVIWELAELVAGELSQRGRGRGDRAQLIRAVLEERVLVPEPEQKRSLRQLAKDLDCSVSRVVACEQRVLAALRERLDGDAVFQRLQQLAAARADGLSSPLTTDDENVLADAQREQFEIGFAAGDASMQGALLIQLADRVSGGAGRLASALFAQLPPEERCERRFALWPPIGATGARRAAG